MEVKTKMQLRTKDKEIQRLRKAVRQLQMENHHYLEQLLGEMKAQVDNVSKWIDLKSKAVPHSHSLVKIALYREQSRHSSFESQLSTSDADSNHSTMERQKKRKEPLESDLLDDTYMQPMSLCDHGVSDLVAHQFAMDVSNPPSSIESDTSDINMPLQCTYSPRMTSQVGSSRGGNDVHLVSRPDNTSAEGSRLCPHESECSTVMPTQATKTHISGVALSSTSAATTTASPNGTHSTGSCALIGMATTAVEESPERAVEVRTTPSRSPLNGGLRLCTCSKSKWGNEKEEEEEPMSDLMAVYKRIQRKDFLLTCTTQDVNM